MTKKALYLFIEELRLDNSSNYKLDVLKRWKTLEFSDDVKEFLSRVYNPRIQYYLKQLPTITNFNTKMGLEDAYNLLDKLSSRELTGNAAKEAVEGFFKQADYELRELFTLIIQRDIKANISVKSINKVFHDLIPTTPYMRCSGLDEKTINSFPTHNVVHYLVQKKSDGIFSYIIKEKDRVYCMTRQGQVWESAILEDTLNRYDWEGVLIGEALIFDGEKEVDRKTGNGLINSFIKRIDTLDTFVDKNKHKKGFQDKMAAKLNEYMDIARRLRFEVWDYITLEEFEKGSSRKYVDRCLDLSYLIGKLGVTQVSMIPTTSVASIEEAQEIAQRYINDGYEGAILKHPDLDFKDGTSKLQVKLKQVLDCDLKVIDIEEGKGKYEGKIGALVCSSSDGKLIVNVGSGLTDDDREYSDYIGKIIEVQYNEVIQSKGKDTYSLFLPRFVEIRTDKSEADDLEKILKGI